MKNKIFKDVISIIIPAYNAAATIERTLTSVVNQTYTNLQVLVINDGSTDNTPQIVSSYIKDYPNLNIVLINKANSGVSETRNVGIDLATGKYVIFLDSDDNYTSNRALEKMHSLLVSKKVDMVVCNFTHPVFQTYLKSGLYNLQKQKRFIKYYEDFFVFGMPWNKLIKRELITCKYNKDIHFAEDELFMIELTKNIDKVYYTKKQYINYYCAPIDSKTPSAINAVHTEDKILNENAGFFFMRQDTVTVRDKVIYDNFSHCGDYLKYHRFVDFFNLDILFMKRKKIEIKHQLVLIEKIVKQEIFVNSLKTLESKLGKLKTEDPDEILNLLRKYIVKLNKMKNDNAKRIIPKCYKMLGKQLFA